MGPARLWGPKRHPRRSEVLFLSFHEEYFYWHFRPAFLQTMNNTIDALVSAGKAQKAQGQTFQSFLASLAVPVFLCGFVTSIHVTFKKQWLRL
jgi:hypothetical protein